MGVDRESASHRRHHTASRILLDSVRSVLAVLLQSTRLCVPMVSSVMVRRLEERECAQWRVLLRTWTWTWSHKDENSHNSTPDIHDCKHIYVRACMHACMHPCNEKEKERIFQ